MDFHDPICVKKETWTEIIKYNTFLTHQWATRKAVFRAKFIALYIHLAKKEIIQEKKPKKQKNLKRGFSLVNPTESYFSIVSNSPIFLLIFSYFIFITEKNSNMILKQKSMKYISH